MDNAKIVEVSDVQKLLSTQHTVQSRRSCKVYQNGLIVNLDTVLIIKKIQSTLS